MVLGWALGLCSWLGHGRPSPECASCAVCSESVAFSFNRVCVEIFKSDAGRTPGRYRMPGRYRTLLYSIYSLHTHVFKGAGQRVKKVYRSLRSIPLGAVARLCKWLLASCWTTFCRFQYQVAGTVQVDSVHRQRSRTSGDSKYFVLVPGSRTRVLGTMISCS